MSAGSAQQAIAVAQFSREHRKKGQVSFSRLRRVKACFVTQLDDKPSGKKVLLGEIKT
jgi:hypothetical protein